MTTNVKTPAHLKGIYNATTAQGDKVVASDATLVIEGHEEMYLLTKQFPWPELSPGGEIEVPMPNGQARWQPQQLKTHQQGQITFMETQAGHVQNMMEQLIFNSGARFNATVYEGTPDDYTRKYDLRDCFVQLDNPDRDFENRGQILLISGTIFYSFFGSDT